MSNFPRREINEIIEIANREPTVQSVFVEGKFDKDLFEKYFRMKGLDKIANVYSIDMIDVNNKLLIEAKLNIGSNKSRVIALATAVSQGCENSASRALCVVDADCDRELGLLRTVPALYYTDFTCMEMYGFEEKIISEIFKFSIGISEQHVGDFMSLMNAVLPTLFVLRCCNDELVLGANMPDISSGFEKKKGGKFSEFSSEKYVHLYIQQNNLNLRRIEITDLFNSRLGKLCIDIRNKAHGHDAVKLFYIYLNRIKALCLNDVEIERIGNRVLLSGVNLNEFDSYDLFSKILSLETNKKRESEAK